MTEEIQKYDTEHAIHLNPAEIFLQAEMYEFADWRKFLTSLGGSAHAGWHFSYFIREQFAMAMSANADFLRSGAKNLPWFMTEIQGGNNTYSAHTPMCPTAEEIAQWLWIVIGSGSKGALFWCLNPRSSGVEAGEWAMLDFQNNPSDRFITAAKIAQLVNDNEKLFSSTKYVNPNINVLYVKESMWVEEKLSRYISDKQNDARQKGGVIKSALGYFEALSQHGYNLNFGDINDFDFDAEDYLNHIVILSHQISIPSKHWSNLDNFVKRGGTLIVDGLTGFYNENAVCLMNNDFPLKNLFGGEVSEFKNVDKLFDMYVSGQKLKTNLWQGTIIPHTGTVISRNNNQPTGIINNYGKGKVFWIPSLLGLGAKISKEYEPLLSIFEQEFDNTGAFRFKKFHEGVLMKNIETSQGVISVLINKNKEKQTIELIGFEKYKPHRMLFQDKGGEIVSQNKVYIYPEETIVIDWRKK
jgi:beta-galactosidase